MKRHLSADGYFLVRVPGRRKDGYMLEHRWLMEQKLGRQLRREEIVHHINGKRYDNRPENLMILPSQVEHSTLHHHTDVSNESFKQEICKIDIFCKCGCGKKIDLKDGKRVRKYIDGHRKKKIYFHPVTGKKVSLATRLMWIKRHAFIPDKEMFEEGVDLNEKDWN